MADSLGDAENHSRARGDRASPASAGLAELRSLLLGPEQRSLRALQARLDDPAAQARDVSRVLPDAIALRDKDPQLTRALAPSIEDAITASVRRDPRPLADALFPVIGPAIRKAIAHALSDMMESFNRALDHSVSWRAIGWRLTALRTGKSFAEVALLNTLEYRVEQVFLIHRESGLLLQHVALGSRLVADADQISAMLTAIRDFAQDSFAVAPGETLEALRVGDLSVYVEQGPHGVLAAVVRGTAPRELRVTFQDAIETIHRRHSEGLESFQGDSAPFEKARPILEACLVAQYRPPRRGVAYGRWLVAGAVVLGAALWMWSSFRDGRRWNGYLEGLQSEPGIVVVDSGRRAGRYFVVGLRDPLAEDPRDILARSELPSDRVDGRWELYQALDPELVLARARSLLHPPERVTLRLRDGVLVATGAAPAQWVSDSERLAPMIPGVRGFDKTGVAVFDAQALEVQIEAISLRFQTGSTSLLPGQDTVLRRLGALLRQLNESAQSLGIRVRVDVIGHTDSDGSAVTNRSLSEARAASMLALVQETEFGALTMTATGVGNEAPLTSGKTEADNQQNRRVSLRVSVPDVGGPRRP